MFTALIFSAITAMTPNPTADDGWLAWQGCWRSDQDAPTNLLCIVPTATGARLITYAAGAVQNETEVIADGVDRPVAQEGCTGTQRAQWSQDRKRIFLGSTMECGENITRRMTGIMSFAAMSSWLNVQAVSSSGGTPVARVLRYHAVESGIPEAIERDLRANKLARETARYGAVAVIGLDDVKEAANIVDEQVVADWLTETRQIFALNAKNLLELADAGVSSAVLDVMIAVSHPELFAVRTVRERNDRYTDRSDPRRIGDRCYDPFYDPWGTFGYGYGGYSRCYGYGYGRYGTLWGYDPYGWYSTRTPIIIVRDGSTGSSDGAKVTRQGYKGPRTSDTARSGSGTSTTNVGSGSSGSSSGGSSSGDSSGSSGGRTAKPRGT